jgi:hypothetical protein
MAFKDGFKPFPDLSTKRLLLRQIVPDDAEPLSLAKIRSAHFERVLCHDSSDSS